MAASEEESELAHLRAQLAAKDEQLTLEKAKNAELTARNSHMDPTTFEQYIQLCHTHLSESLTIQQNKKKATQGTYTQYTDKFYPTKLQPWMDFREEHQRLFDRVCHYLPATVAPFKNRNYIVSLADDFCRRSLASELDLRLYQQVAIETPVANIVNYLKDEQRAQEEFNIGKGITFENHANTLNHDNEEIVEQQGARHVRKKPKSQPASAPRKRLLNADEICVRQDNQKPCIFVEYKPAHKLSVSALKHSMSQAKTARKNLIRDVINSATTSPEQKSELVVAAALVQTYTYMLTAGLEYSILATGEAYVFLRIEEKDPDTLFYHLAVPKEEVGGDADFLLSQTAISQNLSICLMALRSDPRSENWKKQAMKVAPKANEDEKIRLAQLSDEEEEKPDKTSPYRPTSRHGSSTLPLQTRANAKMAEEMASTNTLQMVLRSTKKKAEEMSAKDTPTGKERPTKRQKTDQRPKQTAKQNCRAMNAEARQDTQNSSDSDEGPSTNPTSKPGPRLQRPAPGKSQSDNSAKKVNKKNTQRQYCTHACLAGLARRLPMDESCPNFKAHSSLSHRGNYHPLGQKTFMTLMRRQLGETLDEGCDPLGKQGARGALFRLTLLEYGYTLVGKGTVDAYVDILKYEGKVYKYLEKQGDDLPIPIYLGNISMEWPYFLTHKAWIIHMLMMSWEGEAVCDDFKTPTGREVLTDAKNAFKKVQKCGVLQLDFRSPNVLWNPQTEKVVLIDYERAEILKSEKKEN